MGGCMSAQSQSSRASLYVQENQCPTGPEIAAFEAGGLNARGLELGIAGEASHESFTGPLSLVPSFTAEGGAAPVYMELAIANEVDDDDEADASADDPAFLFPAAQPMTARRTQGHNQRVMLSEAGSCSGSFTANSVVGSMYEGFKRPTASWVGPKSTGGLSNAPSQATHMQSLHDEDTERSKSFSLSSRARSTMSLSGKKMSTAGTPHDNGPEPQGKTHSRGCSPGQEDSGTKDSPSASNRPSAHPVTPQRPSVGMECIGVLRQTIICDMMVKSQPVFPPRSNHGFNSQSRASCTYSHSPRSQQSISRGSATLRSGGSASQSVASSVILAAH